MRTQLFRLSPRTIILLLVFAFAGGAGFALVTRGRRALRAHPTPTTGSAPSVAVSSRPPAKLVPAETILDGKLGSGWEDWGWGSHELTARPPRLKFAGFGGVTFRHPELAKYYGALTFRYRAPADFEDFLEATLSGQEAEKQALPRVPIAGEFVSEAGDGWRQVVVPWPLLNPDNVPIDRVIIRAHKPVGDAWVEIDKVFLTKPDTSAGASAPARATRLTIDCTKQALRINPLIYGIARPTKDAGETAHRVGGNAMTRLNWDIGAWNTGSDWFFENQPGEGDGPWRWFADNVASHTKLAMLVPIIGWVAKDGTSVGFPKSKFAEQRAFDAHRADAGDGFDRAGKPITPGPPTLTSVAAPPEMIQRWLQKLRTLDAARGARSVDMYILDNEPALWNSTHRDVHPEPVSYDELLDRTLRYASVIRDTDPEGQILGPAAWGWPEYFMSAKDQVYGWMVRPDKRAHDDTPLLVWYLQQLAAYEKKTGKRLLDLLDVHYYPQAAHVYGAGAKTDPDTSALRLRSTRALWDSTYRDESWINEPVRLIPRLKEWVDQNYPGRGVCLGEWSFGAEGHISGGLAIAEALGRFGQQGLTSAFYWDKLDAGTPGYWAFRAFRNYDGKGAAFQEWSLRTEESPDVSLFASRDSEATKLVAVVVNRDPTFSADAFIDTVSCGAITSQRSFVYRNAASGFASEQPKSVPAGVEQSVPPYSFAVVELAVTPKAK